MTTNGIHHVAYRCNNAKETVDFYKAALDKTHLESMGLDLPGPIDHGVFDSIYFHDPNSHRLELSAWKASADELQRLRNIAPGMIQELLALVTLDRDNLFIYAEFGKCFLLNSSTRRVRKSCAEIEKKFSRKKDFPSLYLYRGGK